MSGEEKFCIALLAIVFAIVLVAAEGWKNVLIATGIIAGSILISLAVTYPRS